MSKGNVVRKKNGLTVLSIVLIILSVMCLVGGFLLSNTDLFNKPKPNSKTKNADSSKILNDLYRGITYEGANICRYYVLFTDRKMTASDLTNQNKGKFAFYKLFKESGVTDGNKWAGKTYTKEKVESAVKELFGSDVGFTNETIDGCQKIEYDSSKGKYKVGSYDSCGVCESLTNGIINNAEETATSIKFVVRVVFEKDGVYYSDYNKTSVISLKADDYNILSIKDYDKGSLYNVVFKKEKNNYIFDYVEPVKD